MKLRGILSSWFVAVIVLAAILFVTPSAVKRSLVETVDEWFDEYTGAVEEAQGGDDAQDNDGLTTVGNMTVRIADEMSDYAGVETLQLVATRYISEVKALAKVVDIRPMLVLRARYNQAVSALNVAKVAEETAAQEMKRLKSLAKGTGSVATKNVNYAEASWRETSARLQGLNFDLQAINNETRQTWGDEIASWILSAGSKQWQRLLSRKDSLLLVTLPTDVSLAEEVSFIRVTRDHSRKTATKAYFISPAVAIDQALQGETYFFKTTSEKLRIGMRLDAWMPQNKEPLDGVFIPEQAVVWHAGQPWVYIQIDSNVYQRYSIQAGLDARGTIFMEKGFEAGAEIVIRGAQMLLSEEFKWQILDEDDDD